MQEQTALYSGYKELTKKQLARLSAELQGKKIDADTVSNLKLADSLNQFSETDTLLKLLNNAPSLLKQVSKVIHVDPPSAFMNVLKDKFIDRFIELYISQYGISFDERGFDELFAHLVDYIDGKADYYYYAPIFNLESEEDNITFGDCSIRKASDRESAEIALDLNFGFMVKNGPLPTKGFFIIETRSQHYSLNDMRNYLQERIEILNLFTADLVQVFYVKCKLPLFYPVESSSAVEIINARSGVPMLGILTKSDCANFLSFYNKLFHNGKPLRLMFAIKRYGYGRAARIEDDKVVEFIIALESLFSNSDTEIIEKLSLRAAILHRKNSAESILLKRFIKKAYNIRSKIVHGQYEQLAKEIESIKKIESEWISQLEVITRNSIVAFGNLLDIGKNVKSIIDLIDEAVIDHEKRSVIWQRSGIF
jgi:hypothetical protein